MEIELDFGKSVEENASLLFEKSKKAKKKLFGLDKAIESTKKKMSVSGKATEEKQKKPLKKPQSRWFDSLRHFFSSDNFLVVGGKSAKSNEQVVKKHFEKGDMFLHADIPGGSACIAKAEGKEVSETALSEAAVFAAVFSRAWKSGLASVDVYAVEKEQVSKTAPSGTSLATGAFMVLGKRKWFRKTPLRIAIGLNKETGLPFSAPVSAAKKHASAFVEIVPGKESQSNAAKQIFAVLRGKEKKPPFSVDSIARILPPEKIGLENH